MEDCEANYVVIRSLLGSCLSNINKIGHYDIMVFFYLNNKKKVLATLIYWIEKILELCGLITIDNNTVKFVKSNSGYGGNYSWSMFLLENLLTNNYFSRMNHWRYNKKYPRNIYFIGLGAEGDRIINPSTQFQY